LVLRRGGPDEEPRGEGTDLAFVIPEMAIPSVSAFLFDVGGVVVDIDFRRALDCWARSSELSADELKDAFRFDQEYERHERGEMPAADYFAHLAVKLRLAGGEATAKEGWNAILSGSFPRPGA
jgi:glucose-1-phosphatase